MFAPSLPAAATKMIPAARARSRASRSAGSNWVTGPAAAP